ncbi:MAG TPA: D-tyrosyl-tRNA(Tyr) deacylase [Desulfotomaculum sp.]|nr:D-tyrosyl-tRNA(Tyr) deacylase [Desulfotomaculum sp.]
MRAVIQRVTRAAVTVDNAVVGAIGPGLVVLLGVGREDTEADAAYLAVKVAHLRIFEDGREKMNRSVMDVGGEVLVVSQFTLYGDCRQGRRPGFERAARPDLARELYGVFVQKLEEQGVSVATGVFQAHMVVEIVNDGPVTLLLDSKKEF